ncbi:MAG: radical SAM protein [Thermoplasmatota archaeon]
MRKITIYQPGGSFPSVSVTGANCSMSCAHCSGRYLSGMKDVSTKGELLDLALSLWKGGGKGMLVSGGCDPFGAVDFPAHTFDEIRMIKERTDLVINLHCGLIDDRTADLIASSGADRVSFDLVYDDDTIREVLKLRRTKEDYLNTMKKLKGRGVEVVPHILAGLNRGRVSWEFDAIQRVSEMEVGEAVLIILIPTKGTEFHHIDPPPGKDILRLAGKMRDVIKGRLVLGCMRPKSDPGIEVEVLRAGFDGIVLPRRSTVSWLIAEGYQIERMDTCCCFH